ncbi:hypothetical protein A5906_31035 [Bradyrhizobium sacchari]|uniref:Exopolysaccharide production protein YjbE n=1 Tax=Bradyrhizobium sacchari TaxID=1399419 RepID=A0A560JG83_9BRAD|nr:hypothetical protein [Bradyrhizobium sacchari]OPY98558.1 hypothetical protein A5906_31035 [Bradyrhizobium sacchari]TWB52422.1 hypothetical protein FBZ94_109144 [Bradyrhizobium sacchari]TWB70218.1 hypothetical protein FBZ95_108219 [Bradyrhizobium sacchari]
MLMRSMLVGAVLAVSSTIAWAGPCNTAANRDAGSGPVTTGQASETTGTASSDAKEHPPTSAMNKATENTATSSQDAQRQMQSQPTAAEQSKTTVGSADKDC